MKYFVGLLHGFVGLAELFYELLFIQKKKRIKIISMVRVMYAMVSGILPCIMYLSDAQGLKSVSFSDGAIVMVLCCDIVGYFALQLGYHLRWRAGGGLGNKRNNTPIHVSRKTIIICCVFAVFIGWVSLYLWTRSYGSFAAFMRNAARIRSGYGKENSMAFFKHFAKLLNLTTPILVVYIVNAMFNKRYIKMSEWILTAVSATGSMLFMLCSDARGNMGAVVFVIFCVAYELWAKYKNVSIWKLIWIMFATVLGILVLISSASILLDRIRFGSVSDTSLGETKNLIEIIVSEFGFSLRGRLVAMDVVTQGEYRNFLFSDIVNSIFAWIPDRFVPINRPERLWVYNTILIKGINHGTQPTDLITASVYYFHLLGPAVLPVFWGIVVRWFENACDRIDNDIFRLCVQYRMALLLLGWASHFQMYTVVYENMNMFLFAFMLWLVPKVRIGRDRRLS